MLGRLRFDVSQSRGRRYPEPDHPYRNSFQRDRDRVIHARAFRRLEAKTQVFPQGLSDHFRNRLTHTIEVSQIARTIAGVLELDQDLTEALALGHDIGHPPFAHAGEEELDRQMSRFGDHFDHNQHALRIVEIFEQRYARFPGLNLTFEVREGIAKHSHDFAPGEIPELDEYLPGLRPPLEAQLIDLADEVAYNAADLDDGFAAGMLTAEDVARDVPQYREIYEAVETQFPGASGRERFQETLRRLIDMLVTGLIEGTAAQAHASGATSAEEVRHVSYRLAAFTPEVGETDRLLKRFLRANLYSAPAIREERTVSMTMIAAMFELFLKHPERMPETYLEATLERPVHRVICDYIAGMTDSFFRRTWQQMLDQSSVVVKLESSAERTP
jgi:dGTPase